MKKNIILGVLLSAPLFGLDIGSEQWQAVYFKNKPKVYNEIMQQPSANFNDEILKDFIWQYVTCNEPETSIKAFFPIAEKIFWKFVRYDFSVYDD